MKILVVYYSRTGNTRKVAEAIAEAVKGRAEVEVEELKEEVERKKGLLGYMRAGRDAMGKRSSPLQPLKAEAGSFDVVVVGTPVWAWGMVPAVRTFVNERGKELKGTAFFLTTGGTGKEKTFAQMAEACGRTPAATLGFSEKELKDEAKVKERVKEFAEKVLGTEVRN